ncbi:amino acid adenylation domain-containing protein [Pseudomonas citronellolis]|uniref:amino acid adenylation domain-containing protein n=1 Tax=Pseudomonas citronellolis TaxID=53408 RepID=UPI0020A06BBB|nr:non-ribosomal peptide synthetase [Pseudomonas citronellolis]MCP1605335.1 amino acid adenylation domain-containing protein [Pseudomonas citronellolis]MCP1656232.1 amino acid adenylation domain-containing protein [Pseudomonas citronellolis]MCP1723105.1 amino acid adenylation domain-containing protein [Pseudomonas citronellolis]
MNDTLDLDDDLLALLLHEDADDTQRIARRGLAQAPLTFAQRRIWMQQQLDPDSPAYNLPRALRLRGPLDREALERALNALLQRHDVLRSRYSEEDGEPVQCLCPEFRLALPLEDLTALPADWRAGALAERIGKDANTPFDLAAAPPIRSRLLRLDATEHVLLLNMHHILSDGWSNEIIVADLIQAYTQASAGQPQALRRPEIQYADYAAWQRQDYPASPTCRASQEYWRAYLQGLESNLDLPTDFPRARARGAAAGRVALRLSAAQLQGFRRFCQEQGLPPFVLALGAWQLLLSRHCGQQDFCIGVPGATRGREELQELVGYFVSTQVYRARVDPCMPVRDFLQRLRAESMACLEHAECPLELALDDRQLKLVNAHPVLFDWRVARPGRDHLYLGELEVELLGTSADEAKFDLSLDVDYADDGLEAVFEYRRELFCAGRIERLAEHWGNLLQSIAERPLAPCGELHFLSAANWQRTLLAAARNQDQHPYDDCVQRLFERQARRTPNAPALICGTQRLDYAELNRQANRLAHRLITCGVGPEVTVGIAVERSAEMIVGLLAVLKAGGAYVPLDPEYPAERLGWMIEDSDLKLILSQRHLLPRLPLPETLAVVLVDEELSDALAEHDPPCRVLPANLAYLMFTSGSTGRPKGVAIDQQSLARHAQVAREFLDVTAEDRVLQFATFNFDAFVEQLYPALTCGACVVLRGNELWDSERFHAELLDKRISIVDLTTAYWNLLVNDFASGGPRDYGRLRRVNVGGEAMPAESLQAWRKAGLGHVTLLNTYGPTEATVSATLFDCTELAGGEAPRIPIGRALPARALYVLDNAGQAAAPGVVGELMIAGDLLARGYCKRPALTAERFLPDPFSKHGGRMYRSGDLASQDTCGVLEYVGRIDHQVKIRGFRVELGEIEACLQEDPRLRAALVLANQAASGAQLAAYVVAEPEHDADTLKAQLREHLRERLPAYMQPAFLCVLERFPLSPNGKIDRKALPAPGNDELERSQVVPRSTLEREVAGLWAQTLGLERISVEDNFFELGGHSILALQLLASLKRQLSIKVALAELLANPSVAQLCAFIANREAGKGQCLVSLNAAPASAPQLFCLHPSGGVVFCYQPLARRLKDEVRVHGLMYQGYAGSDGQRQGWAEMVEDYCRRIREAQPQGPYHLLGWSLGGPIAMDIAARLEAQGEQVAFLGLIDGSVHARDYPRDLVRRNPGDDGEIRPGQQSELERAAEFFGLLYPHLAERTRQFLREHPAAEMKAFHQWAAGLTSGTGEDDLAAALEGIKEEIMASNAYDIHDQLVASFEDFHLPRLAVRPSCWWSTDHKSAQEISFLEGLIGGCNHEGRLALSVHSPLPHASMVFHAELVESVREALLRQ